MKKVSIIGTVGVPAKYGGFETLVENIIGENCSEDIQYTVFCSSKNYKDKLAKYKGVHLKYIALKANGAQSIPYDIISILKSFNDNDVLLILGVSGCIILPLLRIFSSKKVIVNIDGLEHKREKWNYFIRKFLKYSEAIAVKNADIVISDNKAIQEYVKNEYNKDSVLIAYGGDHVVCDTSSIENTILDQYNLCNVDYSFSLCRIEPENNVHIILEAFALTGMKLMFVGNWKNSSYGVNLFAKYSKCKNIILSDPIYDIPTLNVLRARCSNYIHGHSAGGTNPSLVEAMFFRVPIIAFDCSYNRATTQDHALYFRDTDDLCMKIKDVIKKQHDLSHKLYDIAEKEYRWNVIAQKYESLY